MSFQLSDFIDIHAHILPGIDDGPKNLEDSAALAQCYLDLGIKQVIATPHFIPGTAWAASTQVIHEKITELQKFLQEKEYPLTLFPGMEIAYHKKFQNHLQTNKLLPLGASSFYLLEPSFTDSAEALLLCLEQLLEQGQKIILAHPERIPALQQQGAINILNNLIQQGLRIQLNTGSLLGKFGPVIQQAGFQFIEKNCAHYLATDTHGVRSRGLPTREEWVDLERALGLAVLEQLCCINPAQLLAAQR